MIYPFSILYISDLHIGGNHDAALILEKLAWKLSRDGFQGKRNSIDFLVIAGDIVREGAGTRSDQYKEASCVIDDLCYRCSIDEGNVVIVPGNHDKEVSPAEKDDGEKFFKRCLSSENGWIGQFESHFSGNFKLFCQFYRKYCNEKDYFWDKQLLGNDLDKGIGLIQGLKVYHRYKTVFVCINTEWNYYPKSSNGNNAGHSALAPQYLLPRLVKNSFDKIKCDFPDYTVITVMHRNPYDLPWSDHYERSSVVQSLYYYSDIIVTGHQHSQLSYPPHRMANRAQLLNLGTVAENRAGIEKYQASLMTVDSFNAKIELNNLECEKSDPRFEWKVTLGPEKYDINSKLSAFFRSPDVSKLNGFHSGFPFRCFSKTVDESYVLDTIKKHYKFRDADSVTIVSFNVNRWSEDQKVADVVSETLDRPIILVVYDFIAVNGSDVAKLKYLSSVVKRFHDVLIERIILGEITIQQGLIEIPDYCSFLS